MKGQSNHRGKFKSCCSPFHYEQVSVHLARGVEAGGAWSASLWPSPAWKIWIAVRGGCAQLGVLKLITGSRRESVEEASTNLRGLVDSFCLGLGAACGTACRAVDGCRAPAVCCVRTPD